MTLLERRMLALALIFCFLTLNIWTGRGAATGMWSIGNVPVAQAATGTYYGADNNLASQAAAEWPQRDPNWCGVANVEMIANYTYLAAGKGMPFGSGGQQRIANDLNSSAGVSIWGTAPAGIAGTPGFRADIAADGGTDPRSIAWGTAYESLGGGYWQKWSQRSGTSGSPLGAAPSFTFHNVIYHVNADVAVLGLARTLERYKMPVSVTIAHGLHSDVVTGVYATSDPISSTSPSVVTALNVWDPGVGSPGGGYQSSQEMTVDMSVFIDSAQPYWGPTYNVNSGYDPDPSRGPYTPNSAHPSHWINFRTDIEPDNLVAVSPDMALDENGAVMTNP